VAVNFKAGGVKPPHPTLSLPLPPCQTLRIICVCPCTGLSRKTWSFVLRPFFSHDHVSDDTPVAIEVGIIERVTARQTNAPPRRRSLSWSVEFFPSTAHVPAINSSFLSLRFEAVQWAVLHLCADCLISTSSALALLRAQALASRTGDGMLASPRTSSL
jgi:hypothetical protein